MPAKSGSEFLIAREDDTFSGSYNIVGGQQQMDLALEDQAAEFTHKTSPGLWTEILDGGTVRKTTFSMDAVVIEDAEYGAILAGILGTGARHEPFMLLMPGLGALVGDFQITTNSISGELNQPEMAAIGGTSNSAVTLIPGICTRHAMSASVVLNMAKSSYWVSGTHATAIASVADMTVTRSSKKTDAGGWDFTNGGAVGTLTEYDANVAAVHATAGLLREEESTNEIRNPRGEGAVVGTPGTAPTYWQVSPSSLQEIVGFGTADGWDYVDIRLNGTPTFDPAISPESDSFIVAADGDTFTSAFAIAIVGGDLTNINGFQISILGRTAAGASDGGDFHISSSFTPDSTLRRYRFTETLSGAGATTERMISRLVVDWDGSGAIDVTIRIALPQPEKKAYATSPIRPESGSPAATTRAADVVTVDNAAWSNDNGAGTLYVDFTFNYAGQSGTFPRIAGYGVDADNRVDVYRNEDGGEIYMVVTDGAAGQVSITTGTAGASQNKKIAAAWATNDFALSVQGGSQVTDTSGTVTLGDSNIQLGDSAGGSLGAASLYIHELRYWPQRLTNAELEVLVGN